MCIRDRIQSIRLHISRHLDRAALMDVSGVFQPITTDWSQCDHRYLWRFGHDRKGNQAYRCPKCGRYFFEGVESRSLKRVRVIKALMQPGATIRSTVSYTHLTLPT